MDYEEVRNSLDRVTNTMLDNLECGNGDCTRIVISSHGAPLMRHPPRYVVCWQLAHNITFEKVFYEDAKKRSV